MKKILIDTNIILRLFLADVPTQTKKAKKIISLIEEGKQEGILSILVINELIWILQHFYKQKRQDFIPLILELLSLKKIKVLETREIWLMEVLRRMEKSNLDFTDLYLAYVKQKQNFSLETFDRKLKRIAK